MIYKWLDFIGESKSKKKNYDYPTSLDRGKKHKKEVEMIEDMFLEYVDKWEMKHGKYLSDPSLQGKDFNVNFPLWYTVYESFAPILARLRVPSDYYIELNIEAQPWKGDIDKDLLFKDINIFIKRLENNGWSVVQDKNNNMSRFLNKDDYSNDLRFYIYR